MGATAVVADGAQGHWRVAEVAIARDDVRVGPGRRWDDAQLLSVDNSTGSAADVAGGALSVASTGSSLSESLADASWRSLKPPLLCGVPRYLPNGLGARVSLGGGAPALLSGVPRRSQLKGFVA